ncbi:MAG: hypothetical protein MRY83_21810, partial [Flavobacteriales bacterium]|nr:hypothetical protein [Flavobacteriales bacterium]
MAKLNLTSTLLFLALTFYFSSASALADLKVLGQLQVNPTQVYIGDAIQIDLSINNSGDQSSSYGYVKFFLSTNSTYSSNDIYIGQKYVSSISAGNTVNISHSQTMSSSLNAGNYYLIAFVDANHNTNESNENNNTKYKYISLLEKQPDLFVENRTVSKNTLTKGESFNVSCVVKNYGNATASSSYVGYYLSTNTTLSSNDIFLGKSYLSTVYAGSTRSTSKYVSIPTTVNKGTYYILYKADEDGTVSESDENNNVGNEKIFVIAPDLITSAITVSNGTLNPGQSVTVDATVKNIGDADAGTSRLKYYWSKNSVWDANDTYLGQDYISSLSQNDTESESLNFSVPSNATDGYWYVIAKADANEDVAENSETNNTKYKRVTVVVPKPDLRVLAPALTPSPVEAGSSMSLTIDVSNIGDVSSPSTKVKYYLSTNAYWNASDIYLGESSVSSLSVGNTTTLNKTVTIPSNTSIGTKYIIYFVDEPNSIVEKSESNNKTYKSFLVHKLQPDLVVQSLTLDKSQVIPGNSISIDCNVKNIGNSGAGSSYLKYYWSTNTVLDANDILIGDDYVSSLSAGALSSESINFTVPSNTTAGTYYVLCIADANSSVTEKNENNNKTTRSIQVYIPTPDLRITSQKLNNSSSTIYAKPGEQVTVESIVRNYGNGPAGSCKISYYLSTNNSYSSNDIFLKDENVGTLQPSSNQTITSTLTIPSNTTAGGRYIIGYVDSDFDVAESYESNNTRSTYFIVYIPEPDYVMTAMTLDQSTYIPGDNMSIECKVKNQGNKSGGSSTVKYYFSNNSILDASDTYIESDNVSGLAAGDISPSETINFTLPSNTTAGTKYIIFEADANNDVSEKNESNNIGKKSFQVTIPKPDLRVISPTITPLSVEAGDNLNISATVKNFGNLGSSSTKLKYYLSYNSSWSSNDIYLGESSVSGLSVGSDQTINATVTVPQTTSLGTQYIIFYVDKDDNIDELSESNNWASKHFYVVLVDPDLIATKLTIDTNTTTLATGTPLKITCDVKNIGNEDAPSSRLRYYWSTNTIVDANDIQIGSDYISSLDIDSSETESVNFTIPTNNAAGTHYIIGLADADSTVTEKNESNNRTYKKITVYIPTPDLKIIKQIPSPTTVSPGDQVSMESIVYNSGTGASNSSTDVSYYFSTNSTLSSNDIYLGKGTVSSLARWGRDTVVKSITIPNSATTGNYYIIAYVDSTLNINELYETNNHRATPIAINIPRPDYRVINTLLSESYVIPGDTINISCKVRNYGDKDGGSSTLKYYLSDNSSLDVTTDTYIGSDFVKALDIDSSSYEEIDFIVPNGLSAGKKWIFYVCDANEDVTERYENNNRS